MYRYQQSWGCPDLDKPMVKACEDTANKTVFTGYKKKEKKVSP
jgi:hypothetical protein